MSDPISELDELAALSGKNAKLAKMYQMSSSALRLIAHGTDPWRVWYVSGPPDCDSEPGTLTGEGAIEVFESALDALSSGEIRGSASQQLLRALWDEFGEREREWFGRILRKKMRIGVGATLLNQVMPGAVREFELPLCESLEATLPEGASEFTWKGKIRPEIPCHADIKLDGLRILAIRRGPHDEWELFTRGGDPVETMPGARADLQRLVTSDLGAVAVHGEGFGTSWADSASSIMAKKRSKASGDAGKPLWLFDIVDLREFTREIEPVTTYEARRETLESLFRDASDMPHVRLMPSFRIECEADIVTAFKNAVKIGEGLVLKRRGSVAHLGRTQDWLKLKPIRTWEGIVVGHFMGKPGTRLDGRFGGFLVRLPENGVITEVGSGFSDDQRDHYTAMIASSPDSILGKWVEVEGQPPLTDDGKIRFPVFIRERAPSDLG